MEKLINLAVSRVYFKCNVCGMYKKTALGQSVIFGSLPLSNALDLILGRNEIFSKIRIEHVMLNFLPIIKKIRKNSEKPNYNRGKVVERQRQNAVRNFQT